MQFPDREDANFLMVCDSGSAAAYVYAPHPKYAASSPRVSRPDGADALSCALAGAQKSSRASAAHDWRWIVASNVYGDLPRILAAASMAMHGPSRGTLVIPCTLINYRQLG